MFDRSVTNLSGLLIQALLAALASVAAAYFVRRARVKDDAAAQGETGIADVEARLVSEEIVSFDRPVSGSVRIDVDVERAGPRGTR